MNIHSLTDPQLQAYHKSLKYTGNFFLSEILALRNKYFKVVQHGDFYNIYPLFYTDEISTDWDNVMIASPYMISVPVGFKGLICFRGDDGQIVTNRNYTLEKTGGYCTIVIYNKDTAEILTNQSFTIDYANYGSKQYQTGANGYLTFTPLENEFEVILS